MLMEFFIINICQCESETTICGATLKETVLYLFYVLCYVTISTNG